MAGIFGVVGMKGQVPDPDVFARQSQAAVYVIPRQVRTANGRSFYAGMAENPLAEKNEQPVSFFQRGPWYTLADATLYHVHTLCSLLDRKPGPNPFTAAELIAGCYERWGREGLSCLQGDFSFIIINTATGEFLCARDHVGVRPFYYALRKGSFVFASELRLVKAAFEREPALNEQYLLDSLVVRKSEKEITPFREINRLLPGHYLDNQCCNLQPVSFWKPNPEKRLRFRSLREYHHLFGHLLREAVACRCDNSRNLGIELSGGLDSSAIAGIAIPVVTDRNHKIIAFSNVLPPDAQVNIGDERHFINQMLDFRPISWIGIEGLNESIISLMQKAVKVQGCYIQQNYSLFNKGLFESASAQGVNTLLSGFGGDEAVTASHSTAWNEILAEGRLDIFAGELFYQGISPREMAKGIKLIVKFLLEKLSLTNPRKVIVNRETLEKRFSILALQHGYALKHGLKEHYIGFQERTLPSGYAARHWDNVMHNHLPQRMEYCDTAAAQFGIVYRYPLLDLELIENILAFPAWIKVHHGKRRFLIREAIRGMVPEENRLRNDKSGVPIPHTHLRLRQDRDEILSFVNDCSGDDFLKTIFNFESYPAWYDRLIKRDAHELNYLMPGAFYKYLMIMMYFSQHE